jgi:twitching motility two-component system response regulator PilG
MPSERAKTLVRDGIAAARAGDTARARAVLRDAVKEDANIEIAWLWLAGFATDPVEAIGYLEQVLRLNPKHPRVPTWIEHQKSRLSAPKWYCPICQAQSAERFTTCPSCRSALDLSRPDGALIGEGPDVNKILAGAERLEAVTRERPDYFAHYYLGMALLNLGRADDALVQFRTAQRFRPADSAFAAQVTGLERAMDEAAPLARPPALPGGPNSAPKSVMVVDDSPTIRKLVGLTMAKNGYRVVEAGDGEEALEQIRTAGAPDLLLVDVIMPGMDGLTLCKRIRQNPDTARVPVVILSAHDGLLDKVRGKMAGSDRYLTKPFEPAALMRVVREFCPQGVG